MFNHFVQAVRGAPLATHRVEPGCHQVRVGGIQVPFVRA